MLNKAYLLFYRMLNKAYYHFYCFIACLTKHTITFTVLTHQSYLTWQFRCLQHMYATIIKTLPKCFQVHVYAVSTWKAASARLISVMENKQSAMLCNPSLCKSGLRWKLGLIEQIANESDGQCIGSHSWWPCYLDMLHNIQAACNKLNTF